VYVTCVGTLGLLLLTIVTNGPPSPGSVCSGLSPFMLVASGAEDRAQTIVRLWKCSLAYQEANWWFVLGVFELTYVGLKMFAIPAAFTLCVLGGAIFPLPLAQLLLGCGEAFGSSLCYLLSAAIAQPVVERFFSAKLRSLQSLAAAEAEHMLLFNFFLRLTPFAPNWFINVASPIVGVPLRPFFLGSLIGTQGTLLFLSLTGSTLRDAGEAGFSLGADFKLKGLLLALLMALLQAIPILIIRHKKRLAAAAERKAP